MRSLRVLSAVAAVVLTASLAAAPVAQAAPPRPMVQGTVGSPLAGIPADTRQVISVAAPAGSTWASLSLWEKLSDGSWARTLGPLAARLGSRGLGPAQEGSRYTPLGIMRLDQAFGRRGDPGTALPYFTTDGLDWWDENPSSATYNLHVRRSSSPGGASENLYYSGSAYDYAVNMAWNPRRVPGAGSAFFLHVSTGSPTAGCVSVPQATLQTILRRLDPAKKPLIATRIGTAWMPGNRDTRLTQTTPSAKIGAGSARNFKGTLITTTRTKLSGSLQVRAMTVGSLTWRSVGTAKLVNGSYSFTFQPKGLAKYQVRWFGSSVWEPAVSSMVTIDAR